MRVSALMAELDRLAPFQLAEDWDHVGLQVGSGGTQVGSVLVALDLTDELLDEAARVRADLLLVHHPPIFTALEAVTDDTPAAALVLRAAREGRTVIACHTNLDKTRAGLADQACAILGLENVESIAPAPVQWLKLVGFVPADELADVRAAMFAAGAGVIGDYEHCSFAIPGSGSFRPRETAHPAVGRVGADNSTDEVRLEVVLPRSRRRAVLDAYVTAHSYEQPAYDVYPVEDEVSGTGLGRLGYLPQPMSLQELATLVAQHFHLPSVRFSGAPSRRVLSVAVVPGSGASTVDYVRGRADVLVTGDADYHEAQQALRSGVPIVDLPHETVEGRALERWTDTLAERLSPAGVSVSFFAGPGALWSYAVPAADQDKPSVDDPGGERLDVSDVGIESASVAPQGRYRLFVDGGARGNPGPAGIGVRLEDPDGEVIEEIADAIGTATNNQAEYQAMIAGLELALDRGIQEVTVLADSELVVRQLNGEYRVKDAKLKPLHAHALQLLHQVPDTQLRHIPREQNVEADRLVNQALDAARGL